MRPLRTLPWLMLVPALMAQAPKATESKKAPAKAAAPAAQPAKAPRKRAHAGSTASPQAVAEELNARFTKAMEAGDAAAVASVYTENAELHMSATDVYKGRDGIKTFTEGFLKATPVRSAKVTSTAAHRLGNTITDVGTWSFVVDDHGQSKTMGGTYAQLIWRGKDGQWHIHRDFPLMAATK